MGKASMPNFASLFAPMSAGLAYPDAPGFKVGGGTSEQAAKRFREPAKGLRSAVLVCLQVEPKGLTADEIAARLGRSVLSIRPRVAELHRQGTIVETVERRRNQSGMSAAVWRATPSLTETPK